MLNVSFEGVEGESLLSGIRPHLAVSTGSACNSASAEPSYVLRALGRSERLCESSLRFGLGRSTTEADIDMAVTVLAREVSRLRAIAGAAGCADELAGPGVFRGAAGTREQGTWVQFQIQMLQGEVRATRFQAFGCPHTLAVAAWLADAAIGKRLEAKLPENVAQLRERFDVPVEKMGRLLIIEDAWLAATRAAIDYRERAPTSS